MNSRLFLGITFICCLSSASLFGTKKGDTTVDDKVIADAVGKVIEGEGKAPKFTPEEFKRFQQMFMLAQLHNSHAKKKDDSEVSLADSLAHAMGGQSLYKRKIGGIMVDSIWRYLLAAKKDDGTGGYGLFEKFVDYHKKDGDGKLKFYIDAKKSKTKVFTKDEVLKFSDAEKTYTPVMGSGLIRGMCELTKWGMISSVLGGFGNSMQSVVEKVNTNFWDSMISAVVTCWRSAWNTIFHNGCPPVKKTDINRWKRWMMKMLKDLKSISHSEKRNGHLGDVLSIKGMVGLDGEDGSVVETKANIDKNWEQGKRIYLNQINLIVKQIQKRKRYYKENDEIVFCLDELIASLVGRKEHLKSTGFGGGIYGLVDDVTLLSDFALPEKEGAIALFSGLIEGLLSELGSWVSVAKENKVDTSNYLSGSSYGLK